MLFIFFKGMLYLKLLDKCYNFFFGAKMLQLMKAHNNDNVSIWIIGAVVDWTEL